MNDKQIRAMRLAVGLAVYALRKEASLTLHELSDRCGIHFSTLSRTEAGKRELGFIEATSIVQAFNTDIGSFYALVQAIQKLHPVSTLRAFKQKRDRTVQLATQLIVAKAKKG